MPGKRTKAKKAATSTKPMSQLSVLIDEVSDQKNHSLSDVLMKAKVLASQLRGRKFRQWINAELDGYTDPKDVPDYRVLRCHLIGQFAGPFQSGIKDVPLSTSTLDEKVRKWFSTELMADSVGYIEDLLATEGQIGRSLEFKALNYLRSHGDYIEGYILNGVTKAIPRHSLAQLLLNVRTRLLDFLLELREKHPELNENDDAVAQIAESDIDSLVVTKVYHDCTVVEGDQMRDSYQGGQVGAMGPCASAENMTFIQNLRQAIGEQSLGDLATELERLRQAMVAESKSADQDAAVAAVAQAEDAAKKGDAKGVLAYLKLGGKWAIEVATKIGTAVAEKAIDKAMGL